MGWRGSFRVDEPAGRRWELALEMLREGKAVLIADVMVSLGASDVVIATTRSAWNDPGRIAGKDALRDLDRAESVFTALMHGSPAFRRLVGERELELQLAVDYSTGSVLVARSRNGQPSWANGSPIARES